MTLKEAKQLMSEGKKLTHRYFQDNEWITSNDKGDIIFEDGTVVSSQLFWFDRSGKSWQTDWKLYTEE